MEWNKLAIRSNHCAIGRQQLQHDINSSWTKEEKEGQELLLLLLNHYLMADLLHCSTAQLASLSYFNRTSLLQGRHSLASSIICLHLSTWPASNISFVLSFFSPYEFGLSLFYRGDRLTT